MTSNCTIAKDRYVAVFLLLLFFGLSAGCASVPIGDIADGADIDRALQVDTVRTQPSDHQGATIQWGGTLVSIENRTGETRLEVIARPLSRSGLPNVRRFSSGRFIAVVEGFLDPSDYAKGRHITVIGDVSGQVEGKIGQADYSYPKIDVASHKLWVQSATRHSRYLSDRHKYRYHKRHAGHGDFGRYGFRRGGFQHHDLWLNSRLFDVGTRQRSRLSSSRHYPKSYLRFNFFWHD